MTAHVDFGWRVPGFPVDCSDTGTFLRQIAQMLDLTEGRFTSAWVADHVVPWAQWQAPETPTVAC